MYKEVSQKRKEELERVGNEVVSKFKGELEAVGRQNVERFSQIVKKIETGVDSEIKEFAATLKSEVSESQKSIAEKTQEAYLKMLSEVELVRREKEKRLEESVYKVLFKVSENVIGKALSFEDHQDLVRRVLHDAEQQ
jgi:P2-related tail formation protein